MSMYIDASALVADIEDAITHLSERFGENCVVSETLSVVVDKINTAPVIDVAPVIHAHWIKKIHEWDLGDPPQDYADYTCSNCKIRVQDKTPFCPYCGAKMDEENTK